MDIKKRSDLSQIVDEVMSYFVLPLSSQKKKKDRSIPFKSFKVLVILQTSSAKHLLKTTIIS